VNLEYPASGETGERREARGRKQGIKAVMLCP